MEKLKLGISVGDINGIGLEVILKTLAHQKIMDYCTPIIYGSTKVVSYHKNIVGSNLQFQSTKTADRIAHGKVNILNCWSENINITLGKATEIGGKYAIQSLESASTDLQNNIIDALITAPICKHAMKMSGFAYPGHTEYLTEKLGGQDSLMLMVSDRLKVGVVTNHIPLGEVTKHLTKEKINKKLALLHESLKVDFGIERPTIAVLGLNPHAGDEGTIGTEEDEFIRPAIIENKKKGMIVTGPFPADAYFGNGLFTKYDATLAMYHDQGLVPFKTLSFGQGVNFTAGLSGVRTSPDHGTAFDIAGKNEADHHSFMKALFAALDIARQRKAYIEMHKNSLEKRVDTIPEKKTLKNKKLKHNRE